MTDDSTVPMGKAGDSGWLGCSRYESKSTKVEEEGRREETGASVKTSERLRVALFNESVEIHALRAWSEFNGFAS